MTTSIDKATAQAVATEIQEAILAILAKHNLQESKTVWKYGEWFEMKVEAIAVERGLNGVNLASKEAMYYTKFGWTAYDDNYNASELTAPLGTIFPMKGQNYAFAGIDPKKRKFPIYARRISDGVMVGITENMIPTINLHAQMASK
jgi:hypothetical protein